MLLDSKALTLLRLAAAAAAPSSTNDDKGLDVPYKDEDPEGMKLLTCSDPLDRAAKFLQPLTTLAQKDIEVWIAVYDVAIRRGEEVVISEQNKGYSKPLHRQAITSCTGPGACTSVRSRESKLACTDYTCQTYWLAPIHLYILGAVFD